MAGKPKVTKNAAVRLMTQSVSGHKPAKAKSKAERAKSSARPSQKPDDPGR
jgi:hypothetical protein